jgi:hypothetical protein
MLDTYLQDVESALPNASPVQLVQEGTPPPAISVLQEHTLELGLGVALHVELAHSLPLGLGVAVHVELAHTLRLGLGVALHVELAHSLALGLVPAHSAMLGITAPIQG